MTTALDLADAIGRKAMAEALDVLPTAVSNAVVRGWFPSSWFLVIKSMATQRGLDCPPALFKMRRDSSQSVNAPATRQPKPLKKHAADARAQGEGAA